MKRATKTLSEKVRELQQQLERSEAERERLQARFDASISAHGVMYTDDSDTPVTILKPKPR